MVQKITKYVAADGTEFDTEEEALFHEVNAPVIDELFNKLYTYTSMSSSECRCTAEELVSNFNITVKE